jgi:phage terminase large subunit-like protein
MTAKTSTKTKPTTASRDRTTAYAEAVLSGDIVAGPHVRNACRRHIDDLQRDDVYFDVDEAHAKIEGFFERFLRLSEGQFENRPFECAPAQDFIIGSVFGWKRESGARRFRRAYVEQGKGNGKSPLAGGIGLCGLMYDSEPGAEIYSAGATKDQAGILFRDAVKMVGKSPAIKIRLHPSGGPGKEYNLAYLKNGSFFRPVSRETKKTGSGPRPHFALIDELHEHPDSGIIEILERGFKFRRQPLLFMITNSGSDRNSVCWAEHEHAVKVAAGNPNAKDDDAYYLGEVIDDSTFSYVCALDKGDDPLKDPSCWIKANPLLGVTITEEYLTGVVAQAKAMPGKLNGILRLHF